MPKGSKIYKALICGGEISFSALDTTELVNETIRRHHLSPVAAAALGRTMTAAAYLCSWLKEEGSSIFVTVNGGGAGGKISVSGDANMNLRGNIEHPMVQLPLRAGKLDVAACVGKTGNLTVVRDDGDGIPYVGSCELISGEIAEDFSAYFLQSEQRPTAVALGVRIGTDGFCLGAGGVFLQPLPGADEQSIRFAENSIKNYSNLSARIAENGAEGILEDFPKRSVQTCTGIRFQCRCSREKALSAVLSMGKQEAFNLCKELGKVTVHCPDCNTDYEFTEKEITGIFE